MKHVLMKYVGLKTKLFISYKAHKYAKYLIEAIKIHSCEYLYQSLRKNHTSYVIILTRLPILVFYFIYLLLTLSYTFSIVKPKKPNRGSWIFINNFFMLNSWNFNLIAFLKIKHSSCDVVILRNSCQVHNLLNIF